MNPIRAISADSHVVEPGDLWVKHLSGAFKDRAPRVVANQDRPGLSLIGPGIKPFPVAAIAASGKSGEELKDCLDSGYASFRPSGWDPVERIKDQDIDGMQAEVLYTSLGMPLFGLEDAALQRSCFAVYNDWLAEYCSHNPKRLVGIALISLEDIGEAVKELERCRKLGLRGAMIWGSARPDRPYTSKIYDPFWEAAGALDMPLSLHTSTAKGQGPVLQIGNLGAQAEAEVPGMWFIAVYMFLMADTQYSLLSMIFGGVLERFPKLKIVSAENDTGWIPHFIYRMDHCYEKYAAAYGMPKLALNPGDYVRRQLWATFQDDPIGPITYSFFGAEKYMWASDFPHSDSTWPNSCAVIEKDFADVPAEVTKKIVLDNVAKLYGVPV